jgi:hypothetical protein
MIERLDVRNTPLFLPLEEIMGEARKKFMYCAITADLVYQIDNFINKRIQQEIAEGNVRETFVTPNNRVAKFDSVLVDVDPTDPTQLRINPLWVYEKDNRDLWEVWEGTVKKNGKEGN